MTHFEKVDHLHQTLSLGPIGTSIYSSTTRSLDEFIWIKCGSCATLNNGFMGGIDSSKGVELPISEATSLLIAPSRDPSGELGRKGM
jgi:hypothetical protein